ncbi:MAG: redoxin domain-containing protein [Burkholderiales bacterium]|nr:redoxin domain-containing protein [Burkholderiales bacterium]
MLLRSLKISRREFEAGTGWQLKPEGVCQGEVCIPLSRPAGDPVDVTAVAADMGMPLVEAKGEGLWALGPAAIGARALATAQAPEMSLPDLQGRTFHLSSLRGKKVLLFAWAPY